MVTEEQLRQLYDTELLPSLSAMELSRRQIKWSIPVFIVSALVAFFTFDNEDISFFTVFLPALGIAVTLAIWAGNKYLNYLDSYKKDVVGRIIELIDPEWKYDADGFIQEIEYRASNLIRQDYDGYGGDDLISGGVGGTLFRCSEFYLERKEGSGKNRKTIRFAHGFFIKITFEEAFAEETYITDKTEYNKYQALKNGFLGSLLTRLVDAPESAPPFSELSIAHEEFDQHFMVHSSVPKDQTQVINPELMNALLKIREIFEMKLHLSFIDNEVYCAALLPKGHTELFEPRIYTSGVNYKDIRFIYNMLRLVNTIALVLNKHA